MTPTDQPAAPGVTKEIEDAIDAFNEAAIKCWCEEITVEVVDAARAALLAAIEKYATEHYAQGRRDQHILQVAHD